MSNTVNESGLPLEEADAHEKLMIAMKAFYKLPSQHPSEAKEFEWGIHYLQGLLTVRIARRCFPKGWGIYPDTKEKP